MKTEQEHTLMNAKQVASMFGISQRTVWRLKDAGKLPAPVRLGSSVRWNRSVLAQFIDLNCDMQRFAAMQEVGS